jgi:hypothetical protein
VKSDAGPFVSRKIQHRIVKVLFKLWTKALIFWVSLKALSSLAFVKAKQNYISIEEGSIFRPFCDFWQLVHNLLTL